MSAKRSPSRHALDDDTDLGGRWFHRGKAEESPRSASLSSSANIPSPSSHSQSLSKVPEHLSKFTVDMNKTSAQDLVQDKKHDAKRSAKAQDKGQLMALIRASQDGNEAVARFLIDEGADIEAQDRSGLTALMLASRNGHEAIARLLIDKGANIEAQDRSESTALMLASRNGHEAVARFLIDKGANIEARDDFRSTSLIRASQNGYEAVARLLIEKGAEIEPRDRLHSTALIRASQNGHEFVVQLLIDKGANIEAPDRFELTPLVLALRNGHEAIARLLINKGADIEAQDRSGSTALVLASRNGYEAMVRLLIDKGANIEAQDNSGLTALLSASRNGHEAVVRLFIDKRADFPPSNALGSNSSATMALRPRANRFVSDFKEAPFSETADVTTADSSSDMEPAPVGAALAQNPTLSMSGSLDSNRHWDLRRENEPVDGADSSLRLLQSHVQPTSGNGTRSWLAWNSTNSSPSDSELDPPDNPLPDQDATSESEDSNLGCPATSFESDMMSISDSTEAPVCDIPAELFPVIDAVARRLLEGFRDGAYSHSPSSETATDSRGAPVDIRMNSRPQHETGQSGAQTGRHVPGTTSGNGSHVQTSKRRNKRAARHEDGDGDGDSEQGSARHPSKRRGGQDLSANKSLACPFWKFDPVSHRECLKREKFLGVNRVKQHLARSHAEDAFSCQRCKAKFEDEDEQERHLQAAADTVCVYKQRDPGDRRITRQQQVALSKKSKPGTDREQWFAVWRILFPGCQEPQSAYIDTHVSEDLRLFREYASRQGPLLLLQELRAEGFRDPEVSHPQETLETASLAAASRALESVIEMLVSSLPPSGHSVTPAVDNSEESGLEPSSSNAQIGFTRQEDFSFVLPPDFELQPLPFPAETQLLPNLHVGAHDISALTETLPQSGHIDDTIDPAAMFLITTGESGAGDSWTLPAEGYLAQPSDEPWSKFEWDPTS